MKIKKTIIYLIFLVLLLLLLDSCVPKPPTATALPDVKGETWDYVILGSSIGTWWARNYGALMESDLGVKIVYHDYYVGAQRVSGLLHNVINNERLREDIRNAEVITIGVGSGDMIPLIRGKKEVSQSDREQLEQAVEVFRETYNSMLDEVLTLASPSNTIIRIMDFYFPYVGNHKEKGIYSTTREFWMDFNECIFRAGCRNGIPVANVFAAYNGSDGNDDPVDKGYIDFDRLHPSELGMDVIAEEFQKLGYQYASR